MREIIWDGIWAFSVPDFYVRKAGTRKTRRNVRVFVWKKKSARQNDDFDKKKRDEEKQTTINPLRQQHYDSNQTVLLQMNNIKISFSINMISYLFASCCVFFSRCCSCRYCCRVFFRVDILSRLRCSLLLLLVFLFCFLCYKWTWLHFIIMFIVIIMLSSSLLHRRYKKYRCRLLLFCFVLSSSLALF